jgi:carboxymethylenebutenolidase
MSPLFRIHAVPERHKWRRENAMTDSTTISRRAALGAAATSLTLAGILRDPLLARAAAATLETVKIKTGDGRTVSAALARPAAARAPSGLLIHEWWGLNDQIKAFAKDLADKGYLTLAVDLMGAPATSDPAEAEKIMKAVKPEEAGAMLKAWIPWLAGHAGSTGKVATMGFCFGGGWSLNASLLAPVDATIIYYGKVDKTADELKLLKGPVLGHFAKKDTYINQAMIEGFQAAMTVAGKSATIYWYDAEHGFANPTTARYDADDATLANSRSLAFLKAHIG